MTVMAVLAPAATSVKPAKHHATTTTMAPWSVGVNAIKGGNALEGMTAELGDVSIGGLNDGRATGPT